MGDQMSEVLEMLRRMDARMAGMESAMRDIRRTVGEPVKTQEQKISEMRDFYQKWRADPSRWPQWMKELGEGSEDERKR